MRRLIGGVLAVVAACGSSGSGDPRPVGSGSAVTSVVEGSPPTATPGAGLPEVPMVGYLAADGVVPTVAASRSALTVDGVQVGGTTELATAVQRAKPRDGLAIAADAELPVSLIVQIIEAIAPPGGEVSLLARSGSHQVRIPLARPTATPAPGLGMIVSVSSNSVVLWSTSKQEGSAGEPKVAVRGGDLTKAAAELTTALGDIVQRRWGTGAPRAAEDLGILVEVAPAVPLEAVAELLGAVRATPEGNVLFPRVTIATAAR